MAVFKWWKKAASVSEKPAGPISPAPDLVDFLAPDTIECKEQWLTIGDYVASVLVIRDYPPQAGAAWLSRLFTMPGVIGSVHLGPTDSAELVKAINSSIAEYTARLAAGTRNALLIQRTERNIQDAQELLRMLDQEQQTVFTVTVLLLVLGATKEEMEHNRKRVISTALASGLRPRVLTWQQKEGLIACGPWAWLPADIEDSPRYMPSETVAAALPFAGSVINHGSGIIMGRDNSGGLVIINRWNPPPGLGAEGPNTVVIARTRSGKTFAIKLAGLREYQQGAKLIFIDPEREYKDLAYHLGGVWVDAAGGGAVINPFQVRAIPDESGGQTNTLSSPLAQQIQRLRTFFDLYLRDLTDLQRAHLETAIMELYNRFGITWDTDPATVTRWPDMRDLYNLIREYAAKDPDRWETLAIYLTPAAEGVDAHLWCGNNTVPESADVLVLDVHNLLNLPDHTRRAQYFNVLTYCWDLIRRDRTNERKLLVVDEAWYLADPKVPAALDFLQQMSKRIAKYGGALVTITQNLSDFLAADVARQGEAIFGNATYKLLLRQGERDLEPLVRLLNLSQAEQELLRSATQGHGLFIAGNQRTEIKIEAAPYELAIIDPKQAKEKGIVATEARAS